MSIGQLEARVKAGSRNSWAPAYRSGSDILVNGRAPDGYRAFDEREEFKVMTVI